MNSLIDTTYVRKCIATLDKAYRLIRETGEGDLHYDLYRSAVVKEYEIILEQCGKLLRKALKPYFHSSMEVDRLYFKDVFRHAVLRGIITDEACERWLIYRDTRNDTAHDYGVQFANETLKLVPQFIEDAKGLADAIDQLKDGSEA
jgi:nucleotidyltransferase substrate binding protein (TIGR01987 family)